MINHLEKKYARFDVIEVYGRNNKMHINHIKNAILDKPTFIERKNKVE